MSGFAREMAYPRFISFDAARIKLALNTLPWVLLLFDSDHLTQDGAVMVAKEIAPKLR